MRYLLVLTLALLTVAGCSRKGDDELPARSGDLEARFVVDDDFGILPDTLNIPMILTIYADAAHTLMQQSEAVTVQNHQPASVIFEELAPTFLYLSIRINVSGLPEQCPDVSVFIQQNRVTSTNLINIDVRESEIRCTTD